MKSLDTPSQQSTDAATSYKSSVRQIEEYVDTYITIPPDGGWGWVIVAASFISNFIVDGSIYTFGIFLADISKTFNTTPTYVAISNSLISGFCSVSGPFISAFVNRLGFQITGFSGGVVAAIAFGCSSLASTKEQFLGIFGVIGGIGFGMIYVPSILAIGFYFERWRALATSLAVTGSAAGIIGFPLFIEEVLRSYTWQTKFKVLAGLCMFLAVLSFVYKPIKPTHVLTTKDKKVVQYISSSYKADSLRSLENSRKAGIFKSFLNRFHNKSYPTRATLYKDSTFLMYLPAGPSTSSIFINSVHEGSNTTFLNDASSRMEGRSDRFDRLSTVHEIHSGIRKKWQKKVCSCRCCKDCCCVPAANRPLYRDDIFYGGSLFTLPEYAQSKPSQMSKIKSVEYTISVTRVEFLKERGNERVHCKCCPESIIRTLATMCNCHLLRHFPFLLICLSGFFTILGMYTPFVYLIERANEVHIDKNMSYKFYTALGIASGIGRITSGIISSIPRAKPLIISYISLFICGLATTCSYFLTEAYGHFVFCALFGLSTSCFATLRTPIIAELVGLENLTNAFGIVLLFHGVAAFMGLPLAGFIVKLTDSYNKSFIFAGCTIMLGAILLVPIKYVASRVPKIRDL